MNLERAILKCNKSIEYSGYYCTINKNHKKLKILWKSTNIVLLKFEEVHERKAGLTSRCSCGTAASSRIYIMVPLSPQKTDRHFTKILPFITLMAWSTSLCPQWQKKAIATSVPWSLQGQNPGCGHRPAGELHSVSAELCQQANTNVKAHRFTANLCGKEWGGTWTTYVT